MSMNRKSVSIDNFQDNRRALWRIFIDDSKYTNPL